MNRTALFTPGLILAVHLSCTWPAPAQTITTYAGNDAIFTGNGRQATSVQLITPKGVAADAQGNFYVSATNMSMVFKVSSSGVISVIAGNGLPGYSGDGGPAVAATLHCPVGLVLDKNGNLYFVDSCNSVVRRVDPSGIITTIAGNGQGGDGGDGGPATSASLNDPVALAVDAAGNLYIADWLDPRVRLVKPDGTISTLAGTGAGGYTGDGGLAISATLGRPSGLAVDSAGNVYVADTYNNAIRKISTSGIITTVAGGTWGYSGDSGPATKAAMNTVLGVAVDSSGVIYISDSANERIRRVDQSGTITTFAGNGTAGFSGDGGPASQAMLSTPQALAIDSSGALLVVDGDNSRIRRVAGGSIATVAGSTVTLGDGGSAPLAVVPGPNGLATDGAGDLYIAVPSQNRIRKVAPTGVITTVAGTGVTGYTGDGGPAILATLNGPQDVATDSAGNLYIAEGNEIRRVDASTGKISTFAGTGGCCYQGNGTAGDGGPATAAILYYPTSIAVDAGGNVYFTNQVQLPNGVQQGARVRRVTPDGIINTYAGGGYGFGGDNGPATAALLGRDLRIATGPDGALYIADRDNSRVRRVDPVTKIIATVVGNGQSANSGDGGQATAAGISPWSVTVDKQNNLYVGCVAYVRQVTPAGIISAAVGSGAFAYAGDGGPALAASLEIASPLALDGAGNLFIADGANNRVRIVRAATAAIAVSPDSFDFTAAASQTFTVSANGSGTLAWAAVASTVSGGAWLTVSPASGTVVAGQSGATVTVTVAPQGLAAGDYYGSIEVTSGGASNPLALVTVRLTVGAAGAAPPQVAPGGVLSAASYSLNAPVSPGMLVSIFGSNLAGAGQLYTASSFPWPAELGGTSVTIGGEPMPLYVVTPGQINAMLPFDMAVNATLPLVVTRDGAVSAPEPVSVVPSEPGIFTLAQNGQGTGIVVIVHPDGSQVLAGGSNAAAAGDTLVIYCTGLGALTPRAVAGAPVGYPPLAWANDTVTVTVGGLNAPVLFAGATPGYAGLYQVNATVPAGVAASSQAPLILTQSGRSSPAAVSVPVQ